MNRAVRIVFSLAALAGLGLGGLAAQGEKLGTPKEVVDPGKALIRVHVPVPTARAWFEDQSVLGSNLRFNTGKLDAGKTYTETVTVAWRQPNGLLIADEREVSFSAGQTVDVDFRKPGAKPQRKEAAPPKDDVKKTEAEKKEGNQIRGTLEGGKKVEK